MRQHSPGPDHQKSLIPEKRDIQMTKRKSTTKPSRIPARRTSTQLYKGALGRMEYIITTLATCFVAEGWHESSQSGPMPKRAADVMAYFRARAAGARENAAQEAKVNAFIADCGQSLDWIFDGDVRGMICKAAGAKAMVTRQRVKEIASEINEMESPVLNARNLAMAARMLGSSDDMPAGPGAALDSVADMLVEKLEALEKTRERVWLRAQAASRDAAA
jgi:hypothetical protein